MWLATVRGAGDFTALYASRDGTSYFAMRSWGAVTAGIAELPDVGALLRAGPAARAMVEAFRTGPLPQEDPLHLDAAELAPPVVAPGSLLGVAPTRCAAACRRAVRLPWCSA